MWTWVSHAPGGAQQADVGTAVAHQREVGERRAQYLAHECHGLAAGAPAAYAQQCRNMGPTRPESEAKETEYCAETLS